jgi:hypothetical protein
MQKHSLFTVGSHATSWRVPSLVAGLLLLGGACRVALADSVVVTERAGGKLVCTREEGETSCEVVTTGNFKVVGKVNWNGLIDITTIDQDTTFSVSIGNLYIDTSLSEATKYVAGKRSAVFVYGHYNDNDKFIVDTKVTLHWSVKQFSATVSGKVNSEQGPILADIYSGSAGAFTDTQDLSVSFAGLYVENLPIDITGKTTEKTVFRGRGDDREEFEITKVSLKGKPSTTL